MNWQIERDSAGMPVRMWWLGSGGKPKKPEAPVNPGCACCGMPHGWHRLGCEKRGIDWRSSHQVVEQVISASKDPDATWYAEPAGVSSSGINDIPQNNESQAAASPPPTGGDV